MQPLGVVIVDGDPIARRTLRDALQAGGLSVLGEARDGLEAVELTLDLMPDVVISELRLPGIDGVEAMRRIHAQAPTIPVVFLSVLQSPAEQLAALRAGARGFLSKSTPLEAITLALHGTVRGEAAVSTETATQLVHALRAVPQAGRGLRPVRSTLTPREWEVLDGMCAGDPLSLIADRIGCTEATVVSHLKHVMRKLDIHRRDELPEAAHRLCRLREPVA
jgi:DNA-binding NarL/FixJ family response regulator